MGTTYNLTVFATNASGDGSVSAVHVTAIPIKAYVKPQAYNSGVPQSLPGDTRTPAPALTSVTNTDFEAIIQATDGNVTIENYEVNGGFNLRRDDITFRNCRFTAPPGTTDDAGFPLISAGGSPSASRVKFIDCEFAGNGVNQIDPDGDLTLGWACSEPCNLKTQVHIRSDIWGFVDGFREATNGRYESCYIHDLTFYWTETDSSHNDGFQFVGDVDNFMVIGCNFELADVYSLSSVLQVNGLSTPGSRRTRVSLVANWWEGGGYYTISGAPNLINETFEMVMAYNRFSLQTASSQIWYSDDAWATALDDGRLTLIQNVWDATGTTTYGASVTEGLLIPNPEHYV